MDDTFFKTHYLPNEDAYPYTLTARLGIMLNEIEELFGERDKSWTILGVEFEEEGPLNWYPADSKNIIIRLSNDVENILDEACWELSHEAVHTLSPTGGDDANVLEEGMAVWYSKKYIQDTFNFKHENTVASYDDAYNRVKKILDNDSTIIKKIRAEEPSLYKIKNEHLLKYVKGLTSEEAEILTSKFIK